MKKVYITRLSLLVIPTNKITTCYIIIASLSSVLLRRVIREQILGGHEIRYQLLSSSESGLGVKSRMGFYYLTS